MFQRIQVGIVLVLLPLLGMYLYLKSQNLTLQDLFNPSVDVLHVDEIPIRVMIADTDAERAQGLSGREELGETEGMFFVFPEADRHSFWMKDMQFPIDIVWIGDDLTVLGVEQNVSPDSYPHSFRPTRPVRYVLETNSNYTETFGVDAGDPVRLPLSVIEASK